MNRTIVIVVLILLFSLQCSESYSITKQSILTGSWYPSDKNELLKYLLSSDKLLQKIKGIPLIIVPHAGYMYSAHVAAKAYKAISSYNPDIIIIIGPSHYEYFNGFALPVYDAITTPLGTVRIDQKTIQHLSHYNYFSFNNNAFEPEHSIEIQLPFIQNYFPGISIVPILAGKTTLDQAQESAKVLVKSIAHYKKPLFIISSDFTHHGPRFGYTPYLRLKPQKRIEHIKATDRKALDYVFSNNINEFNRYCESTGITICGQNAILLGLSVFSHLHTKEFVEYSTSAEITGDYDNTVSYAAVVITGKLLQVSTTSSTSVSSDLTANDKQFLLTLARKSIKTMLYKHTPLQYEGSVPPQCTYNAGAFVTLTINGNLRGCIGYIEPIKPLYQTIIECAANAAFNDPRFKPLTKDEYSKIHIEISVLSHNKQIASLDDLHLGTDGLIVAKGNRRGVLLPQVATEYGLTKQQFFQHTCEKAGIYPFEYDSVTMYTFTATIFSENEIVK
jgi:AmmeMemoRadiSam system protein B/AmmeMemoRadiSam system protein A